MFSALFICPGVSAQPIEMIIFSAMTSSIRRVAVTNVCMLFPGSLSLVRLLEAMIQMVAPPTMRQLSKKF